MLVKKHRLPTTVNRAISHFLGREKQKPSGTSCIGYLSQSVHKGQETNGVSIVKAAWFLLPSGWYPAAHEPSQLLPRRTRCSVELDSLVLPFDATPGWGSSWCVHCKVCATQWLLFAHYQWEDKKEKKKKKEKRKKKIESGRITKVLQSYSERKPCRQKPRSCPTKLVYLIFKPAFTGKKLQMPKGKEKPDVL